MSGKCKECVQAIRRGGLLVCLVNPIPRRGVTPGCSRYIDPQTVLPIPRGEG